MIRRGSVPCPARTAASMATACRFSPVSRGRKRRTRGPPARRTSCQHPRCDYSAALARTAPWGRRVAGATSRSGPNSATCPSPGRCLMSRCLAARSGAAWNRSSRRRGVGRDGSFP